MVSDNLKHKSNLSIYIYFHGRLGIEPKTGLNPFFKTALNVFCMHKTDFFFLEVFFFILSNTLEVIIVIKPDPGDHESHFKKVGSIPFGFNTMGTIFSYLQGVPEKAPFNDFQERMDDVDVVLVITNNQKSRLILVIFQNYF